MKAADPSTDVVRLVVPAALEYVRIARLTGSGVASRLGFDVEELEDLKVALDELASMVIDVAADGDLELTFAATGSELTINGRVPMRTGADLSVEELTAQILKAVIDDYEVTRDGEYACFRCVTHRPSF